MHEAIAAKVRALYGSVVSVEDEVTVTSGGTGAIFCAVQAVVRAGEEVILLEPAYDSYEPAIDLAGGRAVGFHCAGPTSRWTGTGCAMRSRRGRGSWS